MLSTPLFCMQTQSFLQMMRTAAVAVRMKNVTYMVQSLSLILVCAQIHVTAERRAFGQKNPVQTSISAYQHILAARKRATNNSGRLPLYMRVRHPTLSSGIVISGSTQPT